MTLAKYHNTLALLSATPAQRHKNQLYDCGRQTFEVGVEVSPSEIY